MPTPGVQPAQRSMCAYKECAATAWRHPCMNGGVPWAMAQPWRLRTRTLGAGSAAVHRQTAGADAMGCRLSDAIGCNHMAPINAFSGGRVCHGVTLVLYTCHRALIKPESHPFSQSRTQQPEPSSYHRYRHCRRWRPIAARVSARGAQAVAAQGAPPAQAVRTVRLHAANRLHASAPPPPPPAHIKTPENWVSTHIRATSIMQQACAPAAAPSSSIQQQFSKQQVIDSLAEQNRCRRSSVPKKQHRKAIGSASWTVHRAPAHGGAACRP
jgi:hypothetical protein